jgi:valyl-tRNA synthetase
MTESKQPDPSRRASQRASQSASQRASQSASPNPPPRPRAAVSAPPAPVEAKQYDPALIEETWYAWWDENKLFHPEPNPEREPHTIMIPLPNVTGMLHLGHALNNSLQDSITRCRRMQGYETLWLPGTDHAGIATQSVVERRLWEEQGLTRHDLGREQMLERIWAWKDEYQGRILSQLRRMGASCDWDRTNFTMSRKLSRAVRRTFLELFREGLIYRGQRLINWSVGVQTALSNDELEYHEVDTSFWDLHYPLSDDPSRVITVSTTRPETMLADTAVAVHPSDERYRDLVGRTVRLPLMDRDIPIIADEILPDPQKGTGAVKVTPGHDFNDYQCGLRHGLPMINILNPDGTLNENAGAYQGLKAIDEARPKVVEDLRAEGRLGNIEPLTHAVAHCYRSGTIVEPYLSDQWFVKMDSLVELARRCYADEHQVAFYPPRRGDDYLRWLESTPDWCISRQIWWGHRIPIWYCVDCTPGLELDAAGDPKTVPGDARPIVPDTDDPDATPAQCPHCGGAHLVQDPDVLDTWFSSQLWPLSTLGWPDDTADLRYFYPTNVLITARDILALWVARMIMMGMKFMDGVTPFHHVYIHGTILDETGNIMSKSRGNGFDPVKVIEGGTDEIRGQAAPAPGIPAHRVEHYKVYGADPLRYGILSLTTGFNQNLKLSVTRTPRDGAGELAEFDVEVPIFEEGRRLCNKLWQAYRGVILPNVESLSAPARAGETNAASDAESPHPEDRWILSRLGHGVAEVTEHLAEYRLGETCDRLYHLFWDDFCSWYLEVAKPRLWGNDDEQSRAHAQRTVLRCADAILRMFHPLMPFITEALWQQLRPALQAAGLMAAPAAPADAPADALADAPADAPADTPGAPAEPALIIAAWPEAASFPTDAALEAQVQLAREVASAINAVRAEVPGVPPGQALPQVVLCAEADSADALEALRPHWPAIARLAKVSHIEEGDLAAPPPTSAAAVASPLRIFVPLEGLIDVAAERARLEKKIAKLQKASAGLERKLANPSFVDKAPAEVVEKDRGRLEENRQAEALLQAQLERLG